MPEVTATRDHARGFLLIAVAVLVLVLVAVAIGRASPILATDRAAADGVAIGDIYQLQAAFHRAKTTQDIDLMMSIWADDARLANQDDPNSPYVGAQKLRAYWLNTGSFKNHRFSLVPSYKIRIQVSGDTAQLYFECHDVADFDQPTRAIVNDTFLAGTVKRVNGKWVFQDMTAGKAPTLSYDRYYYP
jgi:ketosteroid isomerase-like protein